MLGFATLSKLSYYVPVESQLKAVGWKCPSPYPGNDSLDSYFLRMKKLFRRLLRDGDNGQCLSSGVDRWNSHLELFTSRQSSLSLPPFLPCSWANPLFRGCKRILYWKQLFSHQNTLNCLTERIFVKNYCEKSLFIRLNKKDLWTWFAPYQTCPPLWTHYGGYKYYFPSILWQLPSLPYWP